MKDCATGEVSRTAETEAAYSKRVEQLKRMAEAEGATDVARWFVASHGQWSEATIRQYRAALLYHGETTLSGAALAA